MSQKYEWLYNTTYPDKVQEFTEKLNITPNDATLIKQIQALIEQKKFAEANELRKQIPNYKQKEIIAQDFNTVFDTTVALQLEYDSRYTPSYVLSKEKPTNQSEGDYWYRITNIKYFGETEENGTGEKSPDNPYILKGLEVPDTEITLYSLPNGVADEYNVQTRVLTKRIGKVILSGSEDWYKNDENVGTYGRAICRNILKNSTQYFPVISSHFKNHTWNWATGISDIDQYKNECCGFTSSFRVVTKLTLGEWTQWLSQNPVTVLYELETPEIIQL